MGLIGNVLSGVARFAVNNIAPAALTAVTGTLRTLANTADAFAGNTGSAAFNSLVGGLANPQSALGSFANLSSLVGSGAATALSVPGAGLLNLPSLASRLLGQGNGTTFGTTVFGNTGVGTTVDSMLNGVSNAITDTGNAIFGTNNVNNQRWSTNNGYDDRFPQFQGDPTSIADQNKHNERMFKYQQALSLMQQFWQQMSSIQKSNDDTKRAIAQNYR